MSDSTLKEKGLSDCTRCCGDRRLLTPQQQVWAELRLSLDAIVVKLNQRSLAHAAQPPTLWNKPIFSLNNNDSVRDKALFLTV